MHGMRDHDVAPLDVADIVEQWMLEQCLVGLAHHRGTLLVLFADVEQTDLGTRSADHVAHVDATEEGEVDQFPGGAIDIGAGIEHQHKTLGGREGRGNRGPVNPIVQPQENRGTCQDGTGVAGRNKGVGLAVPVECQADNERRVRLLAHRVEGLLGHADDLLGWNDRHAAAVDIRMLGELRLDRIRPPDQHHDHIGCEFPQGKSRPGHFSGRGMISTHRVQRDADHDLIVLNLEALLAGVVAAGATDTVRQSG